jgi:hypothetical protein
VVKAVLGISNSHLGISNRHRVQMVSMSGMCCVKAEWDLGLQEVRMQLQRNQSVYTLDCAHHPAYQWQLRDMMLRVRMSTCLNSCCCCCCQVCLSPRLRGGAPSTTWGPWWG